MDDGRPQPLPLAAEAPGGLEVLEHLHGRALRPGPAAKADAAHLDVVDALPGGEAGFQQREDVRRAEPARDQRRPQHAVVVDEAVQQQVDGGDVSRGSLGQAAPGRRPACVHRDRCSTLSPSGPSR